MVESWRKPDEPAIKVRILFLDGLRGVAILMVVIWHAYGPTFALYLPFRYHFSVIPIRLFWVGVELFFMISGFVILMTLEKCDTLKEFAKRRWLRLFPAMLIVSLLSLGFDHFTGLGPYADRTPLNLIPGILFISPALIYTVTRQMIDSMDVPYWSMYVEVSFYIVVAIVYYLAGTNAAIATVLSLAAITVAARFLVEIGLFGETFARFTAALGWLGFAYFGWFATGALFYQHYKNPSGQMLTLAILVGVLVAMTAQTDNLHAYPGAEKAILLLLVLLFASAIVFARVQDSLSAQTLIFLGVVSYPLYLLHNNIIVGTSQFLGRTQLLPPPLCPVPAILAVIAVAWLIARHAEPTLRRALQRKIKPLDPIPPESTRDQDRA